MFLIENVRSYLSLIILLVIANGLHAQFTVTPSNAALTPENLINTVFLGDGVEVTGVSFNGQMSSTGYFTGAEATFGIDRGIVMSSGEVNSITDQAATLASSPTSGDSNDPDLGKLADLDLKDLVTYEISFIPVNDTIQFRYVFASEEYPQFICSNFNDVFGFFISGPNPQGGNYDAVNLALVPDPAEPSGEVFTNDFVSINNVHIGNGSSDCPPSYQQYYNDNAGSNDFVFGAYLDVFIAQAVVTPCEEYTIKLALSDVGDQNLDSGVFLEAKSFGSGTVDINIQTISLDGSIAEGCNSGEMVFSLPAPLEEEYKIGLKLVDCGNSATPGVDFTGLPDTIVFPPGKDTVKYIIQAIEDNIIEGDERICFEVQRNVCTLDTVDIIIRESILQQPIVPNDTMVCADSPYELIANLPPDFILPPDISFQDNMEHTIDDVKNEPQVFPMEVSGVNPNVLSKGMIKSVCIDFLEARYLTDYDIFLQAPGGQFIELSTDNGNKPFNGMDIDTMINTCFTPSSTLNVNNGNPLSGPIFPANPHYTGDFAIEGVWDDLFDAGGDVNGTWNLIIIDDEKGGGKAKLDGWSITFNPLYFLTYEWTSDVDGVLCANCPIYEDVIKEDKVYTLNLKDSYGCEVSQSFKAEIIPLLNPIENFRCDSLAPDFIRVKWDAPTDAVTGFEITIDNGTPIILPPDALSYDFPNLSVLQEYTFTIKSLGGICGSEIYVHSCTTPNCLISEVIVEEQKNVLCANDINGIIDITNDGNVPPFDYTLQSTGENNLTGYFENLPKGMDTIIIKDGTGCESKFGIEITGPDILSSAFYDVEDASCYGSNDGQAKSFINGGVEPYSFNWESGEVTPNASQLMPGFNKVTITDKFGCVKIDSVKLDEPDSIDVINFVTFPAKCFNTSDGSAAINLSGGSGDLIVAWGDPNKTIGIVANDLMPGDYTLTITDENGCSKTMDYSILSSPKIETSMSQTDVKCENSSDGTATVTVTAGDGPFSYLWSNNDKTETAMNLGIGKHYVTVTNANNCSTVDSVDIQPANPILVSVNLSKVISCHDGNDGEIDITVTGGSQPYSAYFEGEKISFKVLGVEAKEYCFDIVDSENCSVTKCITVPNPDPITYSADLTNVTCGGNKDGTISLTFTNATDPVDVSWTGPNGYSNTGSLIASLEAGTYSFNGIDKDGCTVSGSEVIIAPDSVKIEFLPVNVLCNGLKTGEISSTVSGGVEPFEFSWTGPNGYTSLDQNPKNLEAGLYKLLFKDKNGCLVAKEVNITQPSLPITSGIVDRDTVCFEEKNGLLTVSPNGGTGDLSILWSNNKNSYINSGLSPGEYYVTITDLNNCTLIDTGYIEEFSQIQLTLTEDGSKCTGSDEGQASVSKIIRNGVEDDLSSYQYLWNSNPNQMTISATGLKGGESYTVIVTDKFGCSNFQTIEISNPDPVEMKLVNAKDVSCADGSDGEIEVKGIGGKEPYTFAWDQNTNFQSGPLASNLIEGYYQVTIKDANDCSTTQVYSLVEPLPIKSDYRVFDVLCVGEETGEIEVISSGGIPPYSYNWSTNSDEPRIQDLAKGEYYITITDKNQCEKIDTIAMGEPDEILSLNASSIDVSCFDGQDGRIQLSATGGAGGYVYSRDNIIFNGSNEQIGLKQGEYTVYVKDKNGCIDSLTSIFISQPDAITVDLGPDITINFGETFQFSPIITNAIAPLSLVWKSDNIDLMTCDDCEKPFYNALRSGTVRLEVMDKNGCFAEDLININLKDLNVAFVPTAFTPNGDFNNDVLSVFGIEGTKVKSFQVFDKWGELVYELNDFDINDTSLGWDGNFRGSPMNNGVYIWVVKVESKLGFNEVYKGTTTLIR